MLHSKKVLNQLFVGLMALFILFAVGCAQQIGDIDRVTGEYYLKDDFRSSEWYIRDTVSSTSSASFVGFIGLTGDTDKIVWEITEGYLIAYRSYEQNPGSSQEVIEDEFGDETYREGWEEGFSGAYMESPVAMYPISSHFDIQRSYNSSTGEQSNVIVENSEREWFDREYMRIAWTNVLSTYTMITPLSGSFTEATWEVSQAEGGPDAMQFEYFDPNNIRVPSINPDDYPAGELYYMDFVTRNALSPSAARCWGWYDMTLEDCGASEVEVRTSFLRVPEHTDYEPVFYDDIDQQKFGYFRTERLVYDRQYGTRLSNQIQLANRHNLFTDTWQRDADGEILRDANGRMLAHPMNERGRQPIIYHAGLDYPEEMIPVTNDIAADYDDAFTMAVEAAQGQDIPEDEEMFIFCHNPVTEEDDSACGAVGSSARVGDLRYNFIYWVHDPTAAGLLGYGPSSADPETGELLTGQAFVYGANVDTYAQYAVDIIRFLNGDIDIEDLQDAEFIREAILSRADPDTNPSALVSSDLADVPIDSIDMREMIPESAQDFIAHVEEFGLDDFTHRPEAYNQRMDLLVESGLFASGMDDELVRGFAQYMEPDSIEPSLDNMHPEALETFFDNGTLMLNVFLEAEEERAALAEESIMVVDGMEDAVLGLAQRYAGRTDYDQMWQEMREMIYLGVMTHEIGHTVGLRHNFQGSFDALNYHDDYWHLKTEGVIGVNDDGDVDVVPFGVPYYWADIYGMAQQTAAQVDGGMREYQYSSIMDYDPYFNTNYHGLGHYDNAAITYAYTTGRDRTVSDFGVDHPLYNTQERGYVEVFDNPGGARQIFQSKEGLDSPGYTDLLEDFHYSTIATAMAMEDTFGSWEEVLDATTNFTPDPNLVTSRMSQRRLERFQEVMNQREAENATRPIEVPYLFLSDLWRGSRQSARIWDIGADPLEQALDIIERYRTMYPFEYFRRDRSYWGPSDVLGRMMSRYYTDLIDNYQRWLFGPGFGYTDDGILGAGWYAAAFASLNLMGEVLTTPSYGSYYMNGEDDEFCSDEDNSDIYCLWYYSDESDADVYIPQGTGRRPFSRYDAADGYNYWIFPGEAGHFWSFLGAVFTMTASTSVNVIGADTNADFLSYSLPVYLIFEEEMTNLWNGFFLSDSSLIGPRVTFNDEGKAEVRPLMFTPLSLSDNELMNPETGETFDLNEIPRAQVTMDTTNGLDRGEYLDIDYSFSQQFYPLLYGMAFFNSNYSLHFHDQANIFRLGSGEVMTPGEGYEYIEFCDPNSAGGECYGALMEEGTDNPPLGARLVMRAQDTYEAFLDGDADDWEIDNVIRDMNIIRSMYDWFGQAW